MEDRASDPASNIKSLVGNSSFDAADRFAIVNVLNSYGYFVDQLLMNEFFGLFTASPTIEMWFGANKVVESWTQFKDVAISRQQAFKRENIQRRHVLSAPRFDGQTSNAASGQIYMRLYKIEKGISSLITIGYYEFTMLNEQDHWSICRWIGRLDLLPDRPIPRND